MPISEFRWLVAFIVTLALPCMLHAQTLPGAADAGRVKPQSERLHVPKASIPEIKVQPLPDVTLPQAAKTIHFTLKSITIEGLEAFSPEEVAFIYANQIGQEITLDRIWEMANALTQHHRKAGYFLSRAYVPAQEIEQGRVVIRVVNGYISEVVLDHMCSNAIVEALAEQIKQARPIRADMLESALLQLNDLPGVQVQALIEPLQAADEGATRLRLVGKRSKANAVVSFDNFGSRFLGPYQANINYQYSFAPLHRTDFSVSSTIPVDELQYYSLRHTFQFASKWQAIAFGNFVEAEPGSSLSESEIDSSSVEFGIGLNYQLIRQRQENLALHVQFDGKNTNSDILGDNPLTRDRIRALRGQLDYDTADPWYGYNYLSLGLVRGLEILGASKEGALNLSRAEAEPDFTKFTASYTRQQAAGEQLLLIGQFDSQIASGPLLSAEEFGVGGQQFGRAYDPSEITGDHGVAGLVELRYLGIEPQYDAFIVPYVFYDIGKVWNEDVGGEDVSLSSAGFGIRVHHESGLAGNIGLAFPLTREVSLPVYGRDDKPRFILQLNYGF